MSTRRVQVILDEEELLRIRKEAASAGKSMSRWIREAAREKLEAGERERHIQTLEELRRFFAGCDEREKGKEPDWDEHLDVIRASRGQGTGGT